MSLAQFEDALGRLPFLYSELMDGPQLEMQPIAAWKGLKAVYVFYEPDGSPCHVGRTRNLQQRIRAHLADSHNSASFAFKRTRKALSLPVTYRSGEGRAALLARPEVRLEFDRQRLAIRAMRLRFVVIDNPIEQYLFELYAALQLGTSLSEFETS
jgi:hypothetical protein